MGGDGVREKWYFSILALVEVEAKLEGESKSVYIVYFECRLFVVCNLGGYTL